MIKTGLETENFAIFEFVPVRFDPFRSICLIRDIYYIHLYLRFNLIDKTGLETVCCFAIFCKFRSLWLC